MSPDKHEEYFEINGMCGFITGVPDKCDHIYEETVFILGNGDVLVEKDYLCPTNEATQEYLMKEAEKRDSFIQISTSRCLKCKKIYTPELDFI
jgi:ssDNA-binding Zn-finger/Zn-ribbon topoisomerase 1